MIRKIVKRILKSTIVSYITFFIVNFVVIFLISMLVWVTFNMDDVFCAYDGLSVDGNCPSWSWEIPSPYIPFETIFMMVAVLYITMISIIFVGTLLIAKSNLKDYKR